MAMHRNLIHRSSALAQSASLYNNERLLARGFGATAQRQTPPDPPSLVKSFLYGSEKGQEMQREMEQSYSKVLARGKYVHKMNQHHVRPDKINEYIALMYPPLGPLRSCPSLPSYPYLSPFHVSHFFLSSTALPNCPLPVFRSATSLHLIQF